nr:MAG TPA: hypothetical protein [Caudoviricetes sp.]
MLENPKAVLTTTWTVKLSVNVTKVEKIIQITYG